MCLCCREADVHLCRREMGGMPGEERRNAQAGGRKETYLGGPSCSQWAGYSQLKQGISVLYRSCSRAKKDRKSRQLLTLAGEGCFQAGIKQGQNPTLRIGIRQKKKFMLARQWALEPVRRGQAEFSRHKQTSEAVLLAKAHYSKK